MSDTFIFISLSWRNAVNVHFKCREFSYYGCWGNSALWLTCDSRFRVSPNVEQKCEKKSIRLTLWVNICRTEMWWLWKKVKVSVVQAFTNSLSLSLLMRFRCLVLVQKCNLKLSRHFFFADGPPWWFQLCQSLSRAAVGILYAWRAPRARFWLKAAFLSENKA